MNVVYAVSTTSVGIPHGGTVDLTEGEAWDADDPLVKAKPYFFSKTPTRIKTTRGWALVEQATAAPGEKRNR